MNWLEHGVVAGAVAVMTALAACGDSGGATSSASNSNSASDSVSATDSDSETAGSLSDSMSATEPTEGGMSASGTGTTEASGSMSDSETMGGGGSGNETDGMSGGTAPSSEGGSGGSTTEMTTETPQTTGEPIDCSTAQTPDDCLKLGCMPIEGQAFEFDGAEWCLNDLPSYLGCLPQSGCGDAITTVCKGQNYYQLPSTCFPDSFKSCDPPPDPGMNGYPSC